MNCVEIGREGLFRFGDFMEALTDFEPSIREEEVLDILNSMEKNEFEELDFGKFLFLLAYRDHPPDVEDSGVKILPYSSFSLRDKVFSKLLRTFNYCFSKFEFEVQFG